MALHGGAETVLSHGARGPNGREDPAAGGVKLLVARAPGAQRELLDAVAAEGHVRVAVDEAGDRAAPAAVELLDIASDRLELTHSSDGDDRLAFAQHVGVLEHFDVAEGTTAAGRAPGSRRRELREVADEQPRRRGRRLAHSGCRTIGSCRPCSAAASSASS